MRINFQPSKLVLTFEGRDIEHFRSVLQFITKEHNGYEELPSWMEREWAQVMLRQLDQAEKEPQIG